MKNVIKFAYNELNDFSQENKNDFLYHYTNIGAFKNIVSSKEIWLSDCMYLNDSQELEHGLTKVKALIEKKLEQSTRLTKNKTRIETSLKKLYSEINSVNTDFPSFYVFCLCEKRDLLSQWRGYSKDSCPIGLKFEIKQLGIFKNLSNTFLFKVVYDEKKQNELIEEIIKQFIQNVLEKLIAMETMLSHTKIALFLLAAYFKHKGFEEEEEWRFMYLRLPNSDRKRNKYFLIKNMFMLPYTIFTFDELFPDSNGVPMKEIVIGPQRNLLSLKSIKEYARSERLFLPITESKIPFRT